MLVVTRKPGEGVRIGDAVTVRLVAIEGGRVRLSVDAPPETPVRRLPAEPPAPPERRPE